MHQEIKGCILFSLISVWCVSSTQPLAFKVWCVVCMLSSGTSEPWLVRNSWQHLKEIISRCTSSAARSHGRSYRRPAPPCPPLTFRLFCCKWEHSRVICCTKAPATSIGMAPGWPAPDRLHGQSSNGLSRAKPRFQRRKVQQPPTEQPPTEQPPTEQTRPQQAPPSTFAGGPKPTSTAQSNTQSAAQTGSKAQVAHR